MLIYLVHSAFSFLFFRSVRPALTADREVHYTSVDLDKVDNIRSAADSTALNVKMYEHKIQMIHVSPSHPPSPYARSTLCQTLSTRDKTAVTSLCARARTHIICSARQ